MYLSFLTYDLDTNCRELRERAEVVALSPKSFDVLCYLITHRDKVVSKAELLDAFWSLQVSEAALQKTISQLRKALGCDGKQAIRTYHGRGFRFIADVVDLPREIPPGPDAPAPALQEQRLVGVLCVKLGTGAESDCPEVTDFLDHARISVTSHQGDALRMTLDGFTASFGLTAQYEDAARRAVHCATDLIQLAGDNQQVSSPIIGIDHGPVNLSEAASDVSWGRPSDIERGAADLAELGKQGDILLSATTQHQLRDEVSCEDIGTAFKLVSVNNLHAGVPARPRKVPAQFVGRNAELAFLETALETLNAGHGQSVVLSGPAGIGKTRLLSEFLQKRDVAGQAMVKLQCLPGLSNSPLAPIREMCQTLFARAPTGTITTEIDAALHAELLGETASGDKTLAAVSEHQRKQQSFGLINRMLAAFCAKKPLVLVLEDIHWLDATSRDCLGALLQQVDNKPLLVVMTTRPTGEPPLSEAVLQLPPLGHHDGLQLLHHNTHQAKIDDDVANDLVRRAAGNPFFIEELALAAQSGGNASGTLPQTVQAVISVRIGELDADARRLLFVMAVIGPGAKIDLIKHLLHQSTQTIEATAERLRSMGFILVETGNYSFRHMLINDTAYAMLAPKQRRNLHHHIAQYLESDSPNWRPRPETLAWHYQEAGETDRASAYWFVACRSAMQRLAHRESIAFARNGLSLVPQDTADAKKRQLDLQLYLASALGAVKGYADDDVGNAYHLAREMNQTIGNFRAQIRMLVGLWIHSWVGGNLSQSLSYAQDQLDMAKTTKDPALHLQSNASVGQVLVHKGQLAQAKSYLDRGLDAIKDSPPETLPFQAASVACASFANWVDSLTGNLDKAKLSLKTSKDLAHMSENPLARAIHYGLCVNPFMFVGQPEPCLDYANRAIDVSRTHDFAFWLGTGLVMRGWALGQMGRMEPAFEAFDEGISVFESTGAGVQLSNWYGLKAETLLTAGRFEEALKAAEYALLWANKTQDMHFVPRIHAITARLWSEMNNPEKATLHSQLAAQVAAKFGMTKHVITLLI
ncbi:MAG: AAA family ATPase [Sulfitobacter sp.]